MSDTGPDATVIVGLHGSHRGTARGAGPVFALADPSGVARPTGTVSAPPSTDLAARAAEIRERHSNARTDT